MGATRPYLPFGILDLVAQFATHERTKNPVPLCLAQFQQSSRVRSESYPFKEWET